MPHSPADIQAFVQQHPIAMLYFKGDNCTLCQTLGPKLQLVALELEVPLLTIDMPNNLHLAATEMVLSIPVVKLYAAGREVAKVGAYLQIRSLQALIRHWKKVMSELFQTQRVVLSLIYFLLKLSMF